MTTAGKNSAGGILFLRSAATAFFIIAVFLFAGQTQAREITDMFGRKFTIPDRPQKVYSASLPMTGLLYAIDPSMLAGLTAPIRGWEKRYLDQRLLSLPVLGGWYGQGNTPNMEMILKVMPEVIVVQRFDSAFNQKTNEKIMEAVPVPVVSVNLTTVSDYPEALLQLGRLLGRGERAGKLAAYARKTIAEMKALREGIPEQEKVSVYYAEGVGGLNTECDNSLHAELITLAGGRNVHHCANPGRFGMEKISLEQVLLYNPDVIFVFEKAFYQTILADARWRRVKAVQNKKVYLIPKQPFNWFDRPPNVMRLLGARWVAHCLYPGRITVSRMARETQEFFKLFLNVDLNYEEAERLVQGQ